MLKRLVVLVMVAGCTDGSGGSSSSSSGGVAQSSSGAASSAATSGPPRTPPVINEVSARGEDWIELSNPGAGALDVGGLALADRTADGGVKLAEAVRFPAGTSIAAGGHLLVVADNNAAMPGVQTVCLPDAGPPTCFHARFGVTAGEGDTLFVVDGNDQVLSQFDVAPNAQADGGSWCRSPNLTGSFQLCTPTPGADNP